MKPYLFGDYHGAALSENSANIIAVTQKGA
jgi:hypothetical protein